MGMVEKNIDRYMATGRQPRIRAPIHIPSFKELLEKWAVDPTGGRRSLPSEEYPTASSDRGDPPPPKKSR